MEGVDEKDNKEQESVDDVYDAKHESHKDAKKRILIGLGVILFVIACVLVWLRFGNEIQSACVNDDGVCNIKL